MHWIIIDLKPAYYLKLFWIMWCPEISLSNNLCNEGLVLYPYKNEKSVWHCFITEFFLYFHYTLRYFSMWITSAWIICTSQWYTDWSVNQQVWFTFNSGSDTHFGMRIWGYQDNFLYKKACCYSKDSQNLEVFWIIVVHYTLYALYY